MTDILVAEDDHELRRMIRTALEHDGFMVAEAKNGAELLEQITERLIERDEPRGFDLVVSDICMPGWTGLEILDGIRSAGFAVPFVVITAFADEHTRTRAHQLGGLLLEKPFDIEVLRATVARVLLERELLPKTAAIRDT